MHLDTGALALNALPEDEAAEVEAHLATCDSCPAELAGFLETVALLGSVAAEAPPASLRRAIMARIAVTPQLPPLAPPIAEPVVAPTPPTPPPGPRHAAPPTPPAGPRHAADNVVPLRRWYRRPAALVAAAIAAVVIGGGTVVKNNQVNDQNQQIATPEQCVAQATDKQSVAPELGSGSAIYAPSCGAVTLDVTGLPELPSDQTYQLWAIADQQPPRSLGVLDEVSTGQPQLVTKTTNTGETVLAITAEPAGGSAQPTLPIIWKTTLGT
jgi:anti-sigma-K factor RskA